MKKKLLSRILHYAKVLSLGSTLHLLLVTSIFAQGVSVSGRVTSDDDQEGLPGVNVVEKGTTNGVVTDIDGSYSIQVSDGASLIFSSVGYVTEEIAVGNQSVIDIVLSADVTQLEELVVIGYGTQKKGDLTGAIGSVSTQDIVERGTTSPMQALQGSIPGVQVSNSTGRIGDGYDVTVRGKNTFSGDAEPLYVVDGAITDNIDFLNPQDIAKVDVLKDASSAAIYGSRGTNGVVIITTKGGATVPSGTTVSLETFYGIRQPTRLPEMMSYEDWRYYHLSAYLATTNNGEGYTPEEYYNVVASESSNSKLRERFDNLDGFDWYDAVLQNGMQTNNHLSISHRNGGSSYIIGVGYQKETGNIENEGIDKYTMRSSINQEMGKKLTVGGTVNVSLSEIQQGSSLAMREAFRLNPFLKPWAVDENNNDIVGELYPQPGKLRDVNGDYLINKTSTYNPLLEIQNSSDETRQWNTVGNAFILYKPLEWLNFKSTFSAGAQNYRRGQFWGALTNTGNGNNNLPSSSVTNFESFNYAWDNQLDFEKTFNDHAFKLMALQSIFVDQEESSTFSSTDQPFETEFYNVGSGLQSTYQISNYFRKSQLASFALRLNYAFSDKYLVTLTTRWDGTSKFPEGNQWDAFPSAAIAWKLSNESFLSGSSAVSDLKIRASYGITGNNNIGPYGSVNTLNQQTYYNYFDNTANGWVSTSIANKNLGWEKTDEVNIGVDYGFANHRITGSIDWYNRLSDGLLIEQKLPLETGFDNIKANAGSVRNTGIELLLRTENIKTNLVSWETILTFGSNKNTIESIYGQTENDDVGNNLFIGQSVDVHYNYKFDGIWQAEEADLAESYNQTEGQAKVLDVNNDGVIDPDDDRVFLGSSDPSWTGGLISRLTVGGFDFNFTLAATQGVYAYSNWHANFTNTRDRGRQKADLGDWYIPENNVGIPAQRSDNYPQPRNMGTYWRNSGVGYYRDASFVKVTNISLGYTLPQSVLSKANIQNLRVYVNVLNPFVFTSYDGWDPEWAEASLNIGRVSSMITQFGLSLKF